MKCNFSLRSTSEVLWFCYVNALTTRKFKVFLGDHFESMLLLTYDPAFRNGAFDEGTQIHHTVNSIKDNDFSLSPIRGSDFAALENTINENSPTNKITDQTCLPEHNLNYQEHCVTPLEGHNYPNATSPVAAATAPRQTPDNSQMSGICPLVVHDERSSQDPEMNTNLVDVLDIEMNKNYSKEFEQLWEKKKASAEQIAEKNAKNRLRDWQLERVTLEKAIDEALKEYTEIYESAHAIRLFFESEKLAFREEMHKHFRDWQESSKLTQQISSLKRQRTDDWIETLSRYDVRPTLNPHILNEFQYTTDDESPVKHDVSSAWYSQRAARSDYQAFDISAYSTPAAKQQKKFEVPKRLAPS